MQISNYTERDDGYGWTCNASEHASDAQVRSRQSSACITSHHRLAHIYTSQAAPGKRNVLLDCVSQMRRNCKANSKPKHDGIYSWMPLMSQTHPDRYSVIKRFRNRATVDEDMDE